MERLQWVMSLVDRISGPAQKIDQAVGRVDDRLRSVDRATAAAEAGTARVGSGFARLTMRALPTVVALGRIASAFTAIVTLAQMLGVSGASMRLFFHAARNGATKAAQSLRQLATRGIAALRRIPPHVIAIGVALTGTAIAARSAGRALMSALRFARQGAQMAVMAAGIGAVATAAWGAKEAIDAMVSRDRQLRALTILSGSAAEGLRMRARFADMSEFLGISPGEVARGMQELLTKGFSEVEATRIFQGTADISAISPSADVGRIILAMSQIRQAGVLQGDELNQLAESGLPLESVYKRIGEAMGVAASEVRNLRGTVPAAVAIEAILGGIQDTTGQMLGSVARDASLGLGGQLARLQQIPERFFDAMADGSSAAGQRLTGVLERINAVFNPASPTGQKIINAMVSALEMAVGLVERVHGFFSNLPPGMLERIILGVKVLAIGLAGIIALVGLAAFAFADWIGGLIEPFTALGEKWDAFKLSMVELAIWFTGAGSSVVDGFIAGFTRAAVGAIPVVGGFANQIAETMRGALGIHSPSRVFMEMGAYSGEGFAIGLAGSMPDAVGPDYDYGGLAPASTLSGAGGGATINVTINVDATGGENAQEIASKIREELTATFESLALESGLT